MESVRRGWEVAGESSVRRVTGCDKGRGETEIFPARKGLVRRDKGDS